MSILSITQKPKVVRNLRHWENWCITKNSRSMCRSCRSRLDGRFLSAWWRFDLASWWRNASWIPCSFGASGVSTNMETNTYVHERRDGMHEMSGHPVTYRYTIRFVSSETNGVRVNRWTHASTKQGESSNSHSTITDSSKLKHLAVRRHAHVWICVSRAVHTMTTCY